MKQCTLAAGIYPVPLVGGGASPWLPTVYDREYRDPNPGQESTQCNMELKIYLVDGTEQRMPVGWLGHPQPLRIPELGSLARPSGLWTSTVP